MTEPKYQIGDRLYLASLPVIINQVPSQGLNLYIVKFECFPQMLTIVTEQDLLTEPQSLEESFDLNDYLD